MKFSYADHLWMSRVTGRPKKLGRVLGVDMAWEVGVLNQQPDLEFPRADKEFATAMIDFSEENNNEKYLEFHKYQNSISQVFGEMISRRINGKYIHNYCVTY